MLLGNALGTEAAIIGVSLGHGVGIALGLPLGHALGLMLCKSLFDTLGGTLEAAVKSLLGRSEITADGQVLGVRDGTPGGGLLGTSLGNMLGVEVTLGCIFVFSGTTEVAVAAKASKAPLKAPRNTVKSSGDSSRLEDAACCVTTLYFTLFAAWSCLLSETSGLPTMLTFKRIGGQISFGTASNPALKARSSVWLERDAISC